MDRIQQVCISYIKGYIHDDEGLIEHTLSSSEWGLFFQTVLAHGVASTIYPFISKLEYLDGSDPVILEYWKRCVISSIAMRYRQIEMISDVMNSFPSEMFMVKGLSVAAHYPQPEYRLMSDLDLIIESVAKAAVDKILIDKGYSIGFSDKKHDCYVKEAGLFIELHTTLYHCRMNKQMNLDEWYMQIWIRAVKKDFDGFSCLVMSDEDLLIHQVLHLAMHFSHSEGLLSHLIDMAMIIKHSHEKLDWEYVLYTTEAIGISDFLNNVMKVLKEQFEMKEIPGVLNDGMFDSVEFLELIFRGFPANENIVQDKLFRKFTQEYPYFCKSQVFDPLIWVGEVLVNCFYHKYKPLKAVKEATRILPRYANCRRVLKEIGLM